MSIFALGSLLASVLAAFLGAFVLYRNPRNALNRVFFLFCLSAAYASFTEFGVRQAENHDRAHFWLVAGFLWTFITPLELHFILLFTGRGKLLENKLIYFLLYGPALAFALVHLFTQFGLEMVEVQWGWTRNQPESPALSNLLVIWSIGLALLASFLSLHYCLKTTELTKKRQGWYVFLGFLTSTGAGAATEMIPRYLGTKIPELTSVGVTLQCIFTAYAMWKYELFALTPATAAESIVSTMSDALLLVSPEGRIVRANQAALELLGYEESELANRPLETILAREKEAKFQETWSDQLGAVGSDGDIEVVFETRSGSRIPVSLSGSVMRAKDGAELGTVLVGRDLTERKQAEEVLRQYTAQLEERNEELDAFSHTVAHDLKSPLSLTIGYAETVEESCATLPTEDLRRYLHTIAQNARRMNRIIDELLLLAKVRVVETVTVPLDMASIVAEALQQLAGLIEERQAEIVLPDTWPTALGHGPWIEEVWVNYLDNAIKYGGWPPRVELGATAQADGKVRFWVRDNGSGFAPEEQARLFTPFTRLDQVRAEGHGLGLSIVRRIVERLGGEIGIESQVGQGSVFSFTLPGTDSS